MKDVSDRLSLAEFQQRAVDGLIEAFKRVAWHFDRMPEKQREISLTAGVALLEAPTGSGKTLVMGRVLEGLRGAILNKIVWFWFAPYSGLVSQTRDALKAQCGSLRLRDIYTDRISANARDGDVFVHTWDSMRANRAETRKVRQRSERSLSLEDMLADLRDAGFSIGVVIDEAHLNFGASATATANLYLEILQPHFTILATATPNDKKLEEFEESAGLRPENRIVIDRKSVVEAGLNKMGLKLGYLKLREEDGKFIDLEQATLIAAWQQHEKIKSELASKNMNLTPLMLVQVEDQARGADDPVKRVREKLEVIGVPVSAIRSHTSGEPDPEFHTFAYDPDVEVLIFKVAVATGFDAPRAWTLVSVRPNRGLDFGLQIVGRIMRVHPLVKRLHGQNSLLDSGYVFLSDPASQAGLQAAAEELKTVEQGISLITDRLDLAVYTNLDSISHLPKAVPPKSSQERLERLESLLLKGLLKDEVRNLPEDEQDQAIIHAEAVASLSETGLFGNLPEQDAPSKLTNISSNTKLKRYKLRRDLGIPAALLREVLPPYYELGEDFYKAIAAHFCREAEKMVALLNRKLGKADLTLQELFESLGPQESSTRITVKLSNARIAEEAQRHFEFNDVLDPRLLKSALIERFRSIAEDQGSEANDQDLRRAINLAVMVYPDRLQDAIRHAQAQHIRVVADFAIPEELDPLPDNLPQAVLGAYGIFPPDLNGEERAFAELLDEDTSGTVKWWLRNPHTQKWATNIILPTGRRFFPDFAIAIQGRKSKDQIALVEIKDNGEDGRLQSDINLLKAQVRHSEYGRVTWAFRNSQWVKGVFSELENRIIGIERFSVNALMLD